MTDSDSSKTPSAEGTARSARPARPKRPAGAKVAANPRTRPNPGARKLSETAGPAPTTPITEVRLTVGTLAGSHGVRGELRLRLLTDSPDHLHTVKQVFVGDNPNPVRLLGYRPHGDGGLIRLEGVTTPERAKELSGQPVRILGTDARPLEEGEYFLFQLIGLAASDEQGTPLGTVTDLIETGAHDVLVIEPAAGGADLLVPNHPEFVLDISPEKGTITIKPPVYAN